MTDPPRLTVRAVLIFTTLIALFGAIGVVGVRTYFADRAESAALMTEGIETDAHVIHVEKVSRGPNRGFSITLLVSYETQDQFGVEIAEVFPCSEVQYEEGDETIEVVYSPDDPDAVRMAGCAATIDTWLPLAIGIGSFALSLFLLWQLVSQWRRRPREFSGGFGRTG